MVPVLSTTFWALLSSVPQTLAVDERLSIPLILVNQSRDRVSLSPAEIAEELDGGLTRHTRLSLELVPPDVVTTILDAPPQPPPDFFSRLAHAAEPQTPRAVDAAILVSYTPESRDRTLISLLFLRPRAVVAGVALAKERSADWRSDADAIVLAAGVPEGCRGLLDTLLTPIEAPGPDGFRRALRGIVPLRMKSCLESEGVWRGFSSARIEFPELGFEIAVDGRVLGRNADKVVQLEQVNEGERVLSASHPDYERWEVRATLRGGEVHEFQADPEDLRLHAAAGLRRATRWSAVGVAALGGVALIAAAAQSGSRRDVACVQLSPGSCVDASYERSLGVPLVPFGVGLVTAGAVAGTGVELEDPRDAPWLSIVLSLVSGAAVFATLWGLE